ncbi:hypothetical protein C4564_05875 [Candidatus Microgenomates bacterium]|nr:MAG: hypothetical protein C4564_05875 [Candidatus Microgenomates bacterium]
MEDETLTKRERKRLNRQEKLQAEAQEENTKSMKNKLLTIGGIIVATALVWFGFIKNPGSNTVDTSIEPVSVESVSAEDHSKGPSNPRLVLIEYGDFQCPACSVYQPITNRLAEEFKDSLSVVFRHFPLRSIHKNAQIASQASVAASLQGKFWEMHDKLYETQEEWSEERDPKAMFEKYAIELGLDIDRFKTDIDSEETKDRVNKDYNDAFEAKVNATPTFFLNGVKLDNPRGYEPFKQIVLDKLSEIESLSPEPATDSTPEADITPQL